MLHCGRPLSSHRIFNFTKTLREDSECICQQWQWGTFFLVIYLFCGSAWTGWMEMLKYDEKLKNETTGDAYRSAAAFCDIVTVHSDRFLKCNFASAASRPAWFIIMPQTGEKGLICEQFVLSFWCAQWSCLHHLCYRQVDFRRAVWDLSVRRFNSPFCVNLFT